MQRQLRYLLVAAAFLVVGFTGGWWSHKTTTANTNVNQAAVNTAQVSSLDVNGPLTYRYSGLDGKSVLELLKLAYPKSTTKTSGSLGEYVTGIDGHDASSSQGWIFTVNGTSPTVGAGAYITKSSDTIEWKLTSF